MRYVQDGVYWEAIDDRLAAAWQSIGDRLVNLELKNRKVWPAFIDRSSPTLDQLILGYVFEAVAQGPARGSPSARVSGRVHGRVAAPAADARSHKRHRSPAWHTRGAVKPPTDQAATAWRPESRRTGIIVSGIPRVAEKSAAESLRATRAGFVSDARFANAKQGLHDTAGRRSSPRDRTLGYRDKKRSLRRFVSE
jgi:hypothetical protein